MTHYLKIHPEYFEAVKEGRKAFEFRRNDREYKLGDKLILAEYETDFTGRKICVEITYILNPTKICSEISGYLILGIKPVAVQNSLEYQYILDFVKQHSCNDITNITQLRDLWTAYCLHSGYECDTAVYDAKILEIWSSIVLPNFDFEYFDNYMCEHLV